MAMHTACNRRIRLVVLLACMMIDVGTSEVVMVYTVNRHGARNVLPKTSDLQEPSDSMGGPILLPEGERGCHDAGVAFRQRYLDASTCAANKTCLGVVNSTVPLLYGVYGNWNNFNLLANSSALTRTIMSVGSFIAGIFKNDPAAVTSDEYLPTGQQVVPVFQVAENQDWKIRGYSRCPAYDSALDAWYDSDEFKAEENRTLSMRNAVQRIAPTLNTSLANWWNVYDAFNVWRTYHVGTPMPDVPTELYNQIVDEANWLETAKMRHNLTSNRLGGALLGDVMMRISDAVTAIRDDVKVFFDLLMVSAHYNTQLGLLAALNIESSVNASDILWLKKIPATSSVLAIELHRINGNDFAVRFVGQDGPSKPYLTIPLPCANAGDIAEQLVGSGACTLAAFQALAGPAALNSSSTWCAACSNKQVLACQVANNAVTASSLRASGQAGDTSGASVSGEDNSWKWKVAVSVVVSAVGSAALTAVAMVYLSRRGAAHLLKQQSQRDRFTPFTDSVA